MADNSATKESFWRRFFTGLLPIQQRQLVGTLVFFAIILVVGWVGINEPKRMQTFTKEYEGRSIERGAVTFANNCSKCHGADGKGLPGVAPALNAPDMFDGTRLAANGWAGTLHDYVYLTVSAGRPVKTNPNWPQNMPTWSQEFGGPMRPDEVRDVVNYVLNFSKFYEEGYTGPAGGASAATPTPTPAPFTAIGTDLTSELPPGDAARGDALFHGQENAPDGAILACNSCHHTDGTVLVGPPLNTIVNDVPDSYPSLEAYIRESILEPDAYKVPGFENANMPPNFGQRMDAQTLADIMAYLESIQP